MNDAVSITVDWVEKQKGKKLSEEEKQIIRAKCEIEKLRMPSVKSLEKYGIELSGLECYKKA